MVGEGVEGVERTAQLAQRVLHLSKGPRAERCWAGRAVMVAVIFDLESVSPSSSSADDDDTDMEATLPSFSASLMTESVMSLDSHQSSSVHLSLGTPLLSNHFLFPSGAKKCASGNFFWMRWVVG